ncbi:MAG: hypothetical protein J7L61_04155, partial [Thermoplasmata archaeon]|nr:hypothetical protein [Thermoplasmata archaeon]
ARLARIFRGRRERGKAARLPGDRGGSPGRRKMLALGLIFVFLGASLGFTAYTIHFRLQNKFNGEPNYLPEADYSTGLFLAEYRDDAPITSPGRLIAIWEKDSVINSSQVHLIRKKPPSIFNFIGWYDFLKNPVEAYLTPTEAEEIYSYLAWKYWERPNLYLTDPGNIKGYVIYDNGRLAIQYTSDI